MNKKIIAPVLLALVLAFGLGMFVRSQRASDGVVDGTSFVGGDVPASAEPLPEDLHEENASSTDAVVSTAEVNALLAPNTGTASNASTATGTNISSKPTTRTYESPLGFSFSYDSRLQTENAWIVLTDGYRVSALAVVRYVTEQHCGASGLPEHCRAYLENPAIAFGVIEKAPRDVVKDHLGSFAQYLEPVTINGYTAGQYYAGVEGEGVVTILVPLENLKNTLVIQYTYDTLFDVDDDATDTVLTSQEQKIIVDSVLNTLQVL
jgi:hypothetical protein